MSRKQFFIILAALCLLAAIGVVVFGTVRSISPVEVKDLGLITLELDTQNEIIVQLQEGKKVDAVEPDENGVVKGIVCNRVRAYHIGIQGMLAHKLPYMFKSTFSKNLGRYHQSSTSPYASEPWNLSLALEFDFGQSITNLPLSFRVGAYADFGKLYGNAAGLTLKLSYSDRKLF